MKKKLAVFLGIAVVLFLVFYFYYTKPITRYFYFPYNSANNQIIREVYSAGKVSCGVYGYCLTIDTVLQTSGQYKIIGGARIRLGINEVVTVNSKKDGKAFTISIPNRSLIFRNDRFSSLMLDEMTSQLFQHNDASQASEQFKKH